MDSDRRTLLKTLGGLTIAAPVAGCITGADDEDGDDGTDDSSTDAGADDGAGGDDDQAPEPDVEGSFGMWTDFTDAEEDDVEGFIAEFESATGHTVSREDVADLDDQLETSMPAGDGPDMWAWAHDWVGRFAIRDDPPFLYDASDDLEVDLGTFSGAAEQAVQFDGGVYGLPFGSETVTLFYNEDMIDEPPETIDEMVSIMDDYHDPAAGQYGLSYPVADPYFASGFIQAFGGNMYDEDATEVTLDSDECIQGLEAMQDNLFDYVPADPGYESQVVVFAEEQAPFAINGPWELGNFSEEVGNVGVAELPTIEGNHPRTFSGVQMWYFSAALADASEEDVQAAVDWAEWYTTNPDVTEANANNHGLIPVNTDHTGNIDVSPEVEAFSRQVDHGVPIPSHPDMDSVWGPTTDALERVFNGDQTARAALEEAANQIRDSL